jgi:hypothetical protein
MVLLGVTVIHIVYAGNREQEFVDRINGMTYEEIANRWWNPKFSKTQ